MLHSKTLDNIEKIISSGQPFEKRNKERKIRAQLMGLRMLESNLLFSDVWIMFKAWVVCRFKDVRRITG